MNTEKENKNILGYPTPDEINEKIQQLQKQHPEISQLEQIGTSIKGDQSTLLKLVIIQQLMK